MQVFPGAGAAAVLCLIPWVLSQGFDPPLPGLHCHYSAPHQLAPKLWP